MSVSSDAIFIGISVDDEVARDPELSSKLAEVCPVDIYAAGTDGTLEIVDPAIDECVLCGLCIDAAPEGTVEIRKLYADGELLQR